MTKTHKKETEWRRILPDIHAWRSISVTLKWTLYNKSAAFGIVDYLLLAMSLIQERLRFDVHCKQTRMKVFFKLQNCRFMSKSMTCTLSEDIAVSKLNGMDHIPAESDRTDGYKYALCAIKWFQMMSFRGLKDQGGCGGLPDESGC